MVRLDYSTIHAELSANSGTQKSTKDIEDPFQSVIFYW